jgi:hypothetical protein
MEKVKCCQIDCTEDATWQMNYGNTTDDYTESCDSHIGELMDISVQQFTAYRIDEV